MFVQASQEPAQRVAVPGDREAFAPTRHLAVVERGPATFEGPFKPIPADASGAGGHSEQLLPPEPARTSRKPLCFESLSSSHLCFETSSLF